MNVNLKDSLAELNRRYRRLKSPDSDHARSAAYVFEDPALEFRALHRDYADLAWRHRLPEALLCGLSLQMLATVGITHADTAPALSKSIIDIDRAAEIKIVCAIERELARGWIELSNDQRLLAWALPYMLQVAAWQQEVLYLPDLPSYERYRREAMLAWRVPEDFVLDELQGVDAFRDWLAGEGELASMLKHHLPLRLSDVSFWGVTHAFEMEHPETTRDWINCSSSEKTLPGEPLVACAQFAQAKQAAGEDLWSTITTLPASTSLWPEWAERFVCTASKALAELDRQFTDLLNATGSPATTWPEIELPPQLHRFAVRELLPNRDRIRDCNAQLVARDKGAHGTFAGHALGPDRLMEHLLVSTTEEAELRTVVLYGERWDHSPQGYHALQDAWQRSGVSLDGIERRRRALGPLLLSTERRQINPIVRHRMLEAFRSFMHGLFSAAAVTARAAVEAAARENLMHLAGTDVEIMAEIENMNLAGIEQMYRDIGPPHGTRIANLIVGVRKDGKRAAHPSIGKISENPRRWTETRALNTLRAAKALIEELAALSSHRS